MTAASFDVTIILWPKSPLIEITQAGNKVFWSHFMFFLLTFILLQPVPLYKEIRFRIFTKSLKIKVKKIVFLLSGCFCTPWWPGTRTDGPWGQCVHWSLSVRRFWLTMPGCDTSSIFFLLHGGHMMKYRGYFIIYRYISVCWFLWWYFVVS